MDASAAVVGGSFLKDSARIGAGEARRNLYGVRGSMWAVLTAVVLNLVSSDLLLTDKELSSSGQDEVLYTVASLAIGLGLLVAGVFAADPVSGKKERATLEGGLLTPAKRGAPLLGKVWGALATWFLVFAISVPYVLVAGIGASVPWAVLIYTFVLGTFCVAGFATLTVGISALSRSGRGVMLASMAVLLVMVTPALLGAALQKSWLASAYNALSPVAQARLALENVIVGKEAFLLQLPHVGGLAAFTVIAGVFAALAARGVSPEGGGWLAGREGFDPREPLGTRSRTNEPARAPRGQR
ncbi:ABC transporter permease subunit [Rubrobacter tropicus]|nr:ABC transporter permease subunit [Rubrobacter tropicus]